MIQASSGRGRTFLREASPRSPFGRSNRRQVFRVSRRVSEMYHAGRLCELVRKCLTDSSGDSGPVNQPLDLSRVPDLASVRGERMSRSLRSGRIPSDAPSRWFASAAQTYECNSGTFSCVLSRPNAVLMLFDSLTRVRTSSGFHKCTTPVSCCCNQQPQHEEESVPQRKSTQPRRHRPVMPVIITE